MARKVSEEWQENLQPVNHLKSDLHHVIEEFRYGALHGA